MEYLQYLAGPYVQFSLTPRVLNLIINGIPSILVVLISGKNWDIVVVLNLIINGIPSILKKATTHAVVIDNLCFKPYYKWNTFNTKEIIENNLLEEEF